MTETVVLTVSLSAYSLETVTFYNALETFTFRSTDYVNEINAILKDVLDCDYVAKLKFLCEVCLKFDKLALRCGSCLFEVARKSLAGVLFCNFLFFISCFYFLFSI